MMMMKSSLTVVLVLSLVSSLALGQDRPQQQGQRQQDRTSAQSQEMEQFQQQVGEVAQNALLNMMGLVMNHLGAMGQSQGVNLNPLLGVVSTMLNLPNSGNNGAGGQQGGLLGLLVSSLRQGLGRNQSGNRTGGFDLNNMFPRANQANGNGASGLGRLVQNLLSPGCRRNASDSSSNQNA